MKKDLLIELYKTQSKTIMYYLMKNGCSLEDAQDIVHESFIQAIKYIDGVDNKKISSWLFTVAMNIYKNQIKRKKIVSKVSIDNKDFYKELIDNFDMYETYISKEKSQQILSVLNSLKEEHKSILIFKYEMDLSYREISLLLGIKEEIIKINLYRARNKFKEKWRKLNE